MQTRRVTANLPEELLREAMEASGLGITETLVAGLEALLRKAVINDLKRLRGKIFVQEDPGRKNEPAGE